MTKTIHNEEKYVEKYKDPTAAQAMENIAREKKNSERVQGRRSRVIGKSFEEVIEAACRHYREMEVAIIEKNTGANEGTGKST